MCACTARVSGHRPREERKGWGRGSSRTLGYPLRRHVNTMMLRQHCRSASHCAGAKRHHAAASTSTAPAAADDAPAREHEQVQVQEVRQRRRHQPERGGRIGPARPPPGAHGTIYPRPHALGLVPRGTSPAPIFVPATPGGVCERPHFFWPAPVRMLVRTNLECEPGIEPGIRWCRTLDAATASHDGKCSLTLLRVSRHPRRRRSWFIPAEHPLGDPEANPLARACDRRYVERWDRAW